MSCCVGAGPGYRHSVNHQAWPTHFPWFWDPQGTDEPGGQDDVEGGQQGGHRACQINGRQTTPAEFCEDVCPCLGHRCSCCLSLTSPAVTPSALSSSHSHHSSHLPSTHSLSTTPPLTATPLTQTQDTHAHTHTHTYTHTHTLTDCLRLLPSSPPFWASAQLGHHPLSLSACLPPPSPSPKHPSSSLSPSLFPKLVSAVLSPSAPSSSLPLSLSGSLGQLMVQIMELSVDQRCNS